MNTLRVAVDARPLSHPQSGGFRTYIPRPASRRFRATRGGAIPCRIYCFTLTARFPPIFWRRCRPAVKRAFCRRRGLRTDWLLWNKQVRADAPDVVFGTQNYLPAAANRSGVPTVVTLHDAMGIKRYDWDAHTPRNARERFINRYWYYLTVAASKAARRVLTVSHGSLSEIRTVLTEVPESRFAVVYNGVTLPLPTALPDRDPNTLLCLASPDSRKNLSLLYEALARHGARFGSPPPTLRIVCTSPTTASRTEAVLAKHGLNAELLRGLDDAALAAAYARAAVFVWPSRLEGFGMPPVEMMLTGGAVASSSALCMPEVLGDAPVYFAPDDAEGLVDAARQLLQNDAERRERGNRGRERARMFTCGKMAEQTIAVWEAATVGR